MGERAALVRRYAQEIRAPNGRGLRDWPSCPADQRLYLEALAAARNCGLQRFSIEVLNGSVAVSVDERPHWLRARNEFIAYDWPAKTYFISGDGLKAVKIGKATNLRKRLKALQTGNAVKLRVVACLEGDHERVLHLAFDRFRLHGEWFQFSEEIQDYIINNAVAPRGRLG